MIQKLRCFFSHSWDVATPGSQTRADREMHRIVAIAECRRPGCPIVKIIGAREWVTVGTERAEARRIAQGKR